MCSEAMRALVVLDQRERAGFFAGANEARLGRYRAKDAWMEPPAGQEVWREVLRREEPEVVVGAWSMPRIDAEALGACPSLRYVCYAAGSLRDKVDESFWLRGGVASNWGGVVAPVVAECALALVLGCLRQSARFCREMHVGRGWRDGETVARTRTLFRRRVGIHGFGAVARALLPLLKPFGVRVEAWSAPVPGEVFAAHGVVRADGLEGLFSGNDILVEAEALTPETRGSVNERLIAAMPDGAVFVNVGRGGLVDELALARRAACGEITIGLDVYAEEPLPLNSPLRGLDDALLFPHIAGPTPDLYPACGAFALDNLEAWVTGKPLPGNVSLDHLRRST